MHPSEGCRTVLSPNTFSIIVVFSTNKLQMPRQFQLSTDSPAQRNGEAHRAVLMALAKSRMSTKKLNPTLAIQLEH